MPPLQNKSKYVSKARWLLNGLILALAGASLRLWALQLECWHPDDHDDWSNTPQNSQHDFSRKKNMNQDQPDITEVTATLDLNNSVTTPSSSSSMCDALLQQSFSSSTAWWVHHLADIFQASRLPQDRHWKLHNKVSTVLRMVTPRLKHGQVAFSHQWDALEQLHRKLNQGDEIHIVVLGGSVTAGIQCYTGVGAELRNCAWSARLQTLLESLLPHRNIRVHNLSIPGSNTQIATALIPHFLPVPHPDVILHAYSTNDMHIQTVLNAAATNQTLEQAVLSMSQEFVRTVYQMGCPRNNNKDSNNKGTPPAPLLIWLDDYLGNEQRRIWDTHAVDTAMTVLSHYYGFSAISYANVVRNWVYADTHESLFSPGKWYTSPNNHQMQREIHPSQGMHMVTAWLVAFHLLELALQYCPFVETAWNVAQYEQTWNYTAHGIPEGLLPLKAGQPEWPQPPKASSSSGTVILPPPLTKDLSLEDVSQGHSDICANATPHPTDCALAWVSGIPPSNSQKKKGRNETKAVEQLFSKFIHQQGNWILQDDTRRGDKLGWMPRPDDEMLSSPLIFQFPQGGTRITLFHLKSYGPKWSNSTALVTLATQGTVLHQVTLYGYHPKKTSELYTHEISLNASSHSNSRTPLTLSFQLTDGQNFKLMGLAVCV